MKADDRGRREELMVSTRRRGAFEELGCEQATK